MRLDKINYKDLSRSKIQELIKDNKVLVNGKIINKPSFEVNEDDEIKILLDEYNFPSRAGYKLKKAIEEFNLDFKDKIVLDVGASTGGFTACSLYFGASKVYAIDVGDSQLISSLKEDNRVVSIENKNILDLTLEEVNNNLFDYIVIDVSFVSVLTIIDCLKKFLKKDGLIVLLIKPQFETIKYQTKSHIIKDPTIHKIILNDVTNKLNEKGFYVHKLSYSPIKGSKGNIEFISLISLNNNKTNLNINNVVTLAHKNLKKGD